MPPPAIRSITLPSGEEIPALGQGTWHMGEDPSRRDEEIAALQLGFDLGLTLVDTAEMYGDGAAEELVGDAIAGRRDEVFLVTKVLPTHASHAKTIAACERSLRRLGTDRIDLCLLHWRGSERLEETVGAFEELVGAGKIVLWGVSNFDVADMEELFAVVPGGPHAQTDQVLYNLGRRGIEIDLLPWCRARGVPVMAYSPLEQGRLLRRAALRRVADRHGATPAQVALAWVLAHDGVAVVPKAGTPARVKENRHALDLRLGTDDLAELDRSFPAPTRKRPLEML